MKTRTTTRTETSDRDFARGFARALTARREDDGPRGQRIIDAVRDLHQTPEQSSDTEHGANERY